MDKPPQSTLISDLKLTIQGDYTTGDATSFQTCFCLSSRSLKFGKGIFDIYEARGYLVSSSLLKYSAKKYIMQVLSRLSRVPDQSRSELY